MNPQQATEIGRRIVNTLRPTPALQEWLPHLEPLDLDSALKTLHDLVATVSGGLDIATFLAAYKRRTGTPATATPTGQPSEHCEHCRGSGWEDGPPLEHTVNGERHTYPTVVPCRCTIEARA